MRSWAPSEDAKTPERQRKNAPATIDFLLISETSIRSPSLLSRQPPAISRRLDKRTAGRDMLCGKPQSEELPNYEANACDRPRAGAYRRRRLDRSRARAIEGRRRRREERRQSRFLHLAHAAGNRAGRLPVPEKISVSQGRSVPR